MPAPCPLPSGARGGLLECIGGLIDRRHGGRVPKRYPTRLRLVHRSS
ncbi:hypothetical protein ACO0M4_10945 [Streptomyces sp. RGM 3693]